MKCKKCGKTIPDDSNFCQHCRTPIKDVGLLPEKNVSAGGITCPKCGSYDLQVVANVTAQGVNGKKMCCGTSAVSSGCCGLSALTGGATGGATGVLGTGLLGGICSMALCNPFIALITMPLAGLAGLGCAATGAATTAATTSAASAMTGAAAGASIGMHRAGETQTEHLWVCRHCGQKFKV